MSFTPHARLKKKVQKTLYLTAEQSHRLRAIATAALEAGLRPGEGANESEIVATLIDLADPKAVITALLARDPY